MKKAVLFCFSLCLALGIASYQGIFTGQKSAHVKGVWKTYSKTKNNTINNYDSTEEELNAAKIAEAFSRAPQSIKDDKAIDQKISNDRIIIGEFDVIKNPKIDNLVMSNSLNENWKDALGLELLRFHPEETKILIKEEDSILKVENGKGRLLEQVVVSYLQDNSMLSSFRALVDSQSGQVLETWDRTIHEKIGHHDKEKALSLPLYQDSGVSATIK